MAAISLPSSPSKALQFQDSDKEEENDLSQTSNSSRYTIEKIPHEIWGIIFKYATGGGQELRASYNIREVCKAWNQVLDYYLFEPCWAAIKDGVQHPWLKAEINRDALVKCSDFKRCCEFIRKCKIIEAPSPKHPVALRLAAAYDKAKRCQEFSDIKMRIETSSNKIDREDVVRIFEKLREDRRKLIQYKMWNLAREETDEALRPGAYVGRLPDPALHWAGRVIYNMTYDYVNGSIVRSDVAAHTDLLKEGSLFRRAIDALIAELKSETTTN